MPRLVILIALLSWNPPAASQSALLGCFNTEECCLRRNPAQPQMCGVQSQGTHLEEEVAAGTVLLATAIDGGALDSYLKHVASHLALILAVDQVGGIPPPDKPPREQTRSHWWREVKAAMKNLKQVLKKCRSRRQMLAALRNVANAPTELQIADIEARLAEAAQKMGDTVDELLPCGKE